MRADDAGASHFDPARWMPYELVTKEVEMLFRKSVCRAAFFAVGIAMMAVNADAQGGTVTVAGYGGNLQEDLARTLWAPAAEKAGLTLRQASHDDLASLRVQVQSGSPGWDVMHLGADECAVAEKEGLFELLDYQQIDASGIPDDGKGNAWVATNSYSSILAWRTDKYGDNPPRNWADFWNVEKFPGRRAISSLPQEVIEIALLADGVKPDELYPLDLERAFASLRKIKPHVAVWWSSGAQSAQLIKDGEVDMIAMYGSRVSGVIKDGAPVAFTYQDGVLGYGCVGIVKGSKNAAAAQKLIAGIVSPELQARIPEMIGYYGPANQKAFEVKTFSPEVLEQSNTSPANVAKQINLKIDWWVDHGAEVREEYRNLLIE
jgi:putative spermidine/putrescine transport system substrate-binding protein